MYSFRSSGDFLRRFSILFFNLFLLIPSIPMSINDWSASSIAMLAPKVPAPFTKLPGVIFLSPENRGCFGALGAFGSLGT